jgi:hypothetical protein
MLLDGNDCCFQYTGSSAAKELPCGRGRFYLNFGQSTAVFKPRPRPWYKVDIIFEIQFSQGFAICNFPRREDKLLTELMNHHKQSTS